MHNLELTDEQIEAATELRQKYFLEILQKEPLPAFEGVSELIDAAMNADNFKVAIATSSTREKSKAVLESAKVPYRRMVYIAGDTVKNKKPDPELFLTASAGLKISPSGCAVIEDAPNGVQAAKAAGCKCIAITNSTSADKLSEADMIVDSLKEVDLAKLLEVFQNFP